MRILMTGVSSFTGSWFARTLAKANHSVTGLFRGSSAADYEGIRRERVNALLPLIEPIWGMEFGDERFLNVVSAQPFDILALHGAEMADYRSWNFDPVEAARRNTRNLRQVLAQFAHHGGCRIVATGTVFEPFEGIGDPLQRSFNPYGLSKHLSFEILRMEAERIGLPLGKFVIPNPFGLWEEFRFTSYLAREWGSGKTPTVGTPVYIRDNIDVGLLAAVYRDFCERQPETAGIGRATPSGYIESQGAFAQRVGREVGRRLGRELKVVLSDQTEFPEPLMRVNGSPAPQAHPDWSESVAWDELTEYYRGLFFTK